ncbi:MAG: CxxC-x17-CxxC domain-containing protein [Candidatus Bathyarchaeia archaeon]
MLPLPPRGADTQVPFVPTTGKPVYCRECYQKHRRY